MATRSISLNNIYKKAMHRPITIDNFTLYTKVDGYSGQFEGESKAEKSENYLKHCNSTYNSPTNIRKIFITGKGIAVQYYATPVSAKGNGHHWNWVSFDDVDLFDIGMKIITYSADIGKYNMSKAAGIGAVEPIRYKIDGNGLGIVSHPWVCNNIEEIYFDWTMLMSNEVAPYFQEFCTAEYYQAFLTKTEQSMEVQYNNIKNMFEVLNMGGTRDLRKRFPRLRIIAMISKLQDIMDAEGSINKIDLRFDNVEDSKTSWYKANRGLIAQTGSLVLYCDLSNQLKFPNKEFVIKSNQYKFDYDKLESIVNEYKVKISDLERKKYETPEATESILDDEDKDLKFEISPLETKCLELEKEHGEKLVKNALLYAFYGSGMTTSQLKKVFEQFSKPNRIKYAQMVGLKLEDTRNDRKCK